MAVTAYLPPFARRGSSPATQVRFGSIPSQSRPWIFDGSHCVFAVVQTRPNSLPTQRFFSGEHHRVLRLSFVLREHSGSTLPSASTWNRQTRPLALRASVSQ